MRCTSKPVKLIASYVGFLSLAILAPSSASAGWLVPAPGTFPVAMTSETDVAGKLLAPGTNIEIACNNYLLSEASLTSLTTALGKLEFTNCTTYQLSPLVAIPACKPLEPIVKGGIVTLFLHGAANTPYALLSPHSGLQFANISFHCGALPLLVPITGHLVGEDPSGLLVSAAKHLFQQAPQALFPGHLLKFGANTATIDGSAWIKMASGGNWSAH